MNINLRKRIKKHITKVLFTHRCRRQNFCNVAKDFCLLNSTLDAPSKLISLECVGDKCRNFHHCKLARGDPFVVRRTSFR